MPFEKKFEEFVEIAMSGRGLGKQEAGKAALLQMAEMPAWRDRIRHSASASG